MTNQTRMNILRSIPRPEYPMRVYTGPPPKFSLDHQRSKIKWTRTQSYFNPNPEWLEEIDIEDIYRVFSPFLQLLGHIVHNRLEIILIATGDLYKDFLIKSTVRNYIIRISMPVDPYFKTESEVATMELVRHSTNIPLPIIYAYDSSTENALGLEWILMEDVHSALTLAASWNILDLPQKTTITRTIAEWNTALSTISANAIGSIYMRYTTSNTVDFVIGRVIDSHFTRGNRILYDMNRGPFSSLQDYYAAILDVTSRDIATTMRDYQSAILRFEENSSDFPNTFLDRVPSELDKRSHDQSVSQLAQDRQDELQLLWDGIESLDSALPRLLPTTRTTEVRTMLTHTNASRADISIDEHGTPIAIMNWQNVILGPLVFHTNAPKFLDSEQEEFQPPEDMCFATNMQITDPNERAQYFSDYQAWYLRHLNNYHCTMLRQVYRDTLHSLGSPLADDSSVFQREVLERVMFPTARPESHGEWVEGNLALVEQEKRNE